VPNHAPRHVLHLGKNSGRLTIVPPLSRSHPMSLLPFVFNSFDSLALPPNHTFCSLSCIRSRLDSWDPNSTLHPSWLSRQRRRSSLSRVVEKADGLSRQPGGVLHLPTGHCTGSSPNSRRPSMSSMSKYGHGHYNGRSPPGGPMAMSPGQLSRSMASRLDGATSIASMAGGGGAYFQDALRHFGSHAPTYMCACYCVPLTYARIVSHALTINSNRRHSHTLASSHRHWEYTQQLVSKVVSHSTQRFEWHAFLARYAVGAAAE
jgi:hypothetical protein